MPPPAKPAPAAKDADTRSRECVEIRGALSKAGALVGGAACVFEGAAAGFVEHGHPASLRLRASEGRVARVTLTPRADVPSGVIVLAPLAAARGGRRGGTQRRGEPAP